ncbi:hypothetical protein FACS1894113_0240 [Alphaproteobacteria bacterium]|nr:hypothetical protein FACS1894113_0240 [Alphaproteobacteria bacterium]
MFNKIVLMFAVCSGVLFAEAEYKSSAPEDYKDTAKHNFGSLIKDKNSVFNKFSNRRDFPQKKKSYSEDFNKTWSAALSVLSSLQLEFVDKSSGKIRSEMTSFSEFDSETDFKYQIFVNVKSDGSLGVFVKSTTAPKEKIFALRDLIINKIKSLIVK